MVGKSYVADSIDVGGAGITMETTKPKIYTTEYGTQSVSATDLIQSDAGWAEIQRIANAKLVRKRSEMNAKVSPFTVEIECPKCRETIPEPNTGSLFWAVDELCPEVKCPFCGRVLKIKVPKDTK